ncbi:MAG: FtsQ-type POTRA domain-containing protein [Deltaproteobacteria bacterium]|nr:FtsQ-type POTRA domain-containing protein [Deltaproteobacteria bacterium]
MCVLVVSLGGGIDTSWPWLRAYVIHHPYFTLSEIKVNTGQHLIPEEVISWSGVAKGMSLWKISSTEVEERLKTHPWIRTAHVQRSLPQYLTITVIERQPVAILADGPLTYLDETGEVITRLTDTDDRDLPYVTGPATSVTPDAAGVVRQIPEMLALIRQSGWPEPVSEVHINQAEGFSFFLTGHQINIALTKERWQEQIPHLAAVLRLWHSQGGRPALMDARFAGQVVVRPRQGSRGAGKLRS